MFEVPLPVLIPEERIKSPPFLLIAPLVALPDLTVKLVPAVLAVVCRSIQTVRAAFPPKERSFVGALVPIPTLPPKNCAE